MNDIASPSSPSGNSANPFNPRSVMGLVAVGFIAFVLLLYFLAIGDTGNRDNNGAAHAAANGLNGYSGLVQLLDKSGMDVSVSRKQSNLEEYNLLVLTPPKDTNPEKFAELLVERQEQGPTIVILPKWSVGDFPDFGLPDDISSKIKDGWVQINGASTEDWMTELPEPYAFNAKRTDLNSDQKVSFSAYGVDGNLPTGSANYAEDKPTNKTLVSDGDGNALAISIWGEEGTDFYNDAWSIVFVVEPDLLNNYGMADKDRARLAIELFKENGYDDDTPIVFDLTTNGLGASTNLLTLAFKPPFLAATLCLLAAMLVIGWRAFRRFGPPIAQGRSIALGKRQLVANGAGLIVRAKRYRLLADPYIDISAQRMRDTLGLVRRDDIALDEAIARRLPNEPGFTVHAEALRHARSQSDILRAAKALKALERTLKQ